MRRLSLLLLLVALAIPALAKHNPQEYTVPFTVRTNLGPANDQNAAMPTVQMYYACRMVFTVPDHTLYVGSGQWLCPSLNPGVHGFGKFGNTWGMLNWFEIAWTDESGKIHYHKFNIINNSYSGE